MRLIMNNKIIHYDDLCMLLLFCAVGGFVVRIQVNASILINKYQYYCLQDVNAYMYFMPLFPVLTSVLWSMPNALLFCQCQQLRITSYSQ